MQECRGGATKAVENLQNVKEKRLQEDVNSAYRMKVVCDLIPDSVDGLNLELIGWHRKCYQSFTINLDRLKFSINYCIPEVQRRSPRIPTPSRFLFPQNQCLFCGRNRIKVKKDGATKEELPDKNFVSWINKRSGLENVAAMAENMQHIAYGSVWRNVNGVDLPAAEAHFHESCQKNSMQVTVTSNITRKVSVNLVKQIFPVNLQLTVKLTVM